jgi:DNA-directed RNA polymerase
MFHFKDDQSISIDANEPYAMLGACFEWVRYVDFCNKPDYNRFKRYRSYYLMGVDATSSGHQILSMIMNDGTYQKELNLAVSEDLYTEEPSHYYTSMAREYLEEAKEKKSLVAEKLLKLENYEVYYNEHRKADEFKKLTKNDVEKIALNTILIPLFKPLLMKGVYNATKFTFKKDVEEHIDKQFRLSLDKIKMGFRSTHTFLEKDFINELTNSMWQKKNETTMSYYIEIMKKISQTFSDHGLQIKWLTRTGGYVFQMYNKLELTPTWKSIPTFLQTYKKVSKDRLPNTSKVQVSEELRKMRQAQKIYIPNLTDEIDKRKMINATPPSFIHSLDADIIFEFSKYMMKLPYLSFFLVHDTIDFPHSYYSKIMLMLAKANHAIFAETKNKEGKTMLELFLDNLLDILQSHSPAAKKDADKLREEISNLLKEAEKVSEKQFDYSALMYSRIYY